MTCSIESAIISDAAPAKYRRNVGLRRARNEVVALTAKGAVSLWIELRIAPEEVVLVERQAPLGGEIRREPLAARDAVVQRRELRILPLDAREAVREGVAQALDHLEERQIEIRRALRPRERLEVAHVLRHAVLEEKMRAPLRLRLLILVVKAAAERMVGIVHFHDPVADGELLLVQPEPCLHL